MTANTKPKRNMLTQDYLKKVVTYEPSTGLFTRNYLSGKGRKPQGTPAGHLSSNGYLLVSIDMRHYAAHRLAWLYVYGTLPKTELDHIDGDRTNNRIDNLREVSRRLNCQNKKTHRQGRLPGCYFHKQDKAWMARIRVGEKRVYLGNFSSEIAAYKAYAIKHKELFGIWPLNHNPAIVGDLCSE
jgi:hypothetical protein